MVGTANFLSHVTDDFKRDYSRAIYKLLAKQDLAFRHGAKGLHLGENDCDVNDRFVFLFICKKVLTIYTFSEARASTLRFRNKTA